MPDHSMNAWFACSTKVAIEEGSILRQETAGWGGKQVVADGLGKA